MTFGKSLGLLVVALLFLLMAAVQYNDTDPMLWVSLYTFAAALTVWAAFWPLGKGWMILEALLAVGVGVTIVLFEGVPILGDSEVGRELGGVVILLGHSYWLSRVARSPLQTWVDGRSLN